jgi:hypothetical protein
MRYFKGTLLLLVISISSVLLTSCAGTPGKPMTDVSPGKAEIATCSHRKVDSGRFQESGKKLELSAIYEPRFTPQDIANFEVLMFDATLGNCVAYTTDSRSSGMEVLNVYATQSQIKRFGNYIRFYLRQSRMFSRLSNP